MSVTESHNAICLIDSHAHLDMEQFGQDRDEVIERALKAGVKNVVSVGIDLASSNKAIELSNKYPSIVATAGIHPQEINESSEDDIKTLAHIAEDSRVAAIGEIGLDFHGDYMPKEQQLKIFKAQLALADELQKPVVIHCRQAEADMLEVLAGWDAGHSQKQRPPGVIHCFSGTLETAEKYLRWGFYISLGAYIGYPSSRALRGIIERLPLDRLMLETDSPFLPPQSKRGQRNEPSYVVEAARELAAIKGLPMEVIAEITTGNTRRLFGISG